MNRLELQAPPRARPQFTAPCAQISSWQKTQGITEVSQLTGLSFSESRHYFLLRALQSPEGFA
jgi:hypothetical protein